MAALARTEAGLLAQLGAILATGNSAVVEADNPARAALVGLPREVAERIATVAGLDAAGDLRAVLFAGDAASLLALNRRVAAREGRIVPVLAGEYPLDRLLEERSVSTNTAAAGGNASLMAIG